MIVATRKGRRAVWFTICPAFTHKYHTSPSTATLGSARPVLQTYYFPNHERTLRLTRSANDGLVAAGTEAPEGRAPAGFVAIVTSS